MEGLAQCEKVLMIPDTPVDFLKKPSLRSDHEVDLSCLALPDQGKSLRIMHTDYKRVLRNFL